MQFAALWGKVWQDEERATCYRKVVSSVNSERRGQLPVVFFQAGDARHLPYTFWQARHWAGDSSLILLGDESNRHYRGLEHVPIRDFASTVPRLRDRYVHISSNTPEFEFFCLARWLVMAEFAQRQGLREFLYLDSDVLIYESPAEIVRHVPNCRMATQWIGDVSAGVSPAVTYVRDFAILEEITAVIMQFYGDPKEVEEIQLGKERVVRKKLGGVSDMFFLARYALCHGRDIANLWKPEEDGNLDINILQSAGFRLRAGLKDVEFRGGQPYGFYEPTLRWVRFATLHFNGHSKKIMGRYLGRPMDLDLVSARCTERVQKMFGRHKPALF